MPSNLVKIDGLIQGKNLTEDKFTDEFFPWLEAHGWCFGGMTDDVKERECCYWDKDKNECMFGYSACPDDYNCESFD